MALVLIGGLLGLTACIPPDPATVTAPKASDTLHAYGGIVYGSAQIGNRVYISGTFNQVGYNDGTRVAQSYLAAFDATTGRLDTGFQPKPNGEVRTLLASADGTRLYAGGMATSYNGAAVGRLASLQPGHRRRKRRVPPLAFGDGVEPGPGRQLAVPRR